MNDRVFSHLSNMMKDPYSNYINQYEMSYSMIKFYMYKERIGSCLLPIYMLSFIFYDNYYVEFVT